MTILLNFGAIQPWKVMTRLMVMKVKSCLLWTRMITVKVWQKTFLPEEYKKHFEKLQVVNDMDAHELINVKTGSELKDKIWKT